MKTQTHQFSPNLNRPLGARTRGWSWVVALGLLGSLQVQGQPTKPAKESETKNGQVELKFVVHTDDFDKAVAFAQKGAGEVEKREIYFLELKSGGADLDSKNLILRLREKPGKKDDSTVKLRGPEAALVNQAKYQPESKDVEAKLETDRVIGGKDVVSFSITAKLEKEAVAKLLKKEKVVEEMFVKLQSGFLKDYAGDVPWKTAVPVGPVKTTKWEFPLGDIAGVTAEVWELPDCTPSRMIEFSIKADKTGADGVAAKIAAALKTAEIRPAEKPESKTRLVLDCLLKKAP